VPLILEPIKMKHLRANLWLLGLSLLICAVLYPLALWAIGQVVFPFQAQGSLVDRDGNPVTDEKDAVASRIIAQPFSGDEYFRPRPSAVSYNGAGSGATNWGASNPALRKRVVGMLGPILKYRDDKPVGPDIVTWTRENLQQTPSILAAWVKEDANLAERWVNADQANADFVAQWANDHGDLVSAWKNANPETGDPTPSDLAALYLESFATGGTTAWPETDGKDLQLAFFEVWWKAHPAAEFALVPADMVMASGSGLDPHITLDNALYQLDRVAGKWAGIKTRDQAAVRREIEELLRESASAPLAGLAGVPLVNVFEINVALLRQYAR
jgi:K+-transporting ATPase ATPase C chain